MPGKGTRGGRPKQTQKAAKLADQVRATEASRQYNRQQARKKTRENKKARQVEVSGIPSTTALLPSDVRIATNAPASLALGNQVRTVTVDKPLPTSDLVWFAVGFIARAFERGFEPSSAAPYDGYYALTFMANLLASYAQAQAPPVTQMPYWLLCICHAISPKSGPFEGAKVNYQFTVDGTLPIVPAVNQVIGYSGYGYQWSAGWPSGSTVNDFPTVSTSGSSYTTALGAAAFQEICKFMETSAVGMVQKKLSRLVPATVGTPFKNDVSAFALFKSAEGTGSSGEGGGIYGQLQHEVPLLHPLLALFGCGEDSFIAQDPARNFNWMLPIAGDPVTLSALASTLLPTSALKMKRNLRVKPIDFLQFGDVLAQWVQQITQAYYNDVANTITTATATGALCPLTLQEMLLILRAVIMAAFKESQAAIQGLYPFLPSSSGDNEFVPYVCGVNSCPLIAQDMMLPSMFVENIRALVARKVFHGASQHDYQWYLPALGQYALDVLSSADYLVTYTPAEGSGTPVSAFQTGAIWEKETTEKGALVKTRMTEAAISLVDGSSSTTLVFINDPGQLKVLIGMWNKWLTTSGVGSYSMKLCTFGTEPGINALCSIGMTRIWANTSAFEGSRKQRGRESRYADIPKSKEVIRDTRLKDPKYSGLVGTPYATRTALIDVSQGEILSAPYEQVLGTWILPIDEDEVIVGEESTVIQRWQFMYGEGYSISRVSAVNGTTLSSIDTVYASKMTKAKLAEKSDVSDFIDQMAAQGRGGILSGLVAGLVQSFAPSLGGIANSIAGALPI